MKRWFVLLLAVAICCAPLSAVLAEAGVQADEALVESPDGAALSVPEEIEVPLEGDGEGNDPPAAIDVAESPVPVLVISTPNERLIHIQCAAVIVFGGVSADFSAARQGDSQIAIRLRLFRTLFQNDFKYRNGFCRVIVL